MKKPVKHKCCNCKNFIKIADIELSGGKCKTLLDILQLTNSILPSHGLIVQDGFKCIAYEQANND